MDLFKHTSRFTAITQDYTNGNKLGSSSLLGDVITTDQSSLLNTKTKDVVLGSLMSETSGVKSIKQLAKLWIDAITGNVQSYARVFNI